MAKLDRVVMNQAWTCSVSSTVSFLPAGISDHTPTLLDIANDIRISRPFKFLNCWPSSKTFSDNVSFVWTQRHYGKKISFLFQKLKALRAPLRSLHKDEFSNLDKRVIAARNTLLDCQTSILETGGSTLLFRQEKVLLEEFKLYGLLRLRLSTNVPNSSTFSLMMVLPNIFTLLSKKESTTDTADNLPSSLFQQGTLQPCHTSILIAAITDDEILEALKYIDRNKSPRVDGFSSGFFLDTWGTVGHDFCAAARDYFVTGVMPKAANSTLITLVPKVTVGIH
ncbi:uncharacterized protein LOC141617306 [Silene latifolia]|uniref:uncharacterized protein LOC141617306 n=1 Tax=Silene latifolia TaxID=37657 RepID=UPI003D77C684